MSTDLFSPYRSSSRKLSTSLGGASAWTKPMRNGTSLQRRECLTSRWLLWMSTATFSDTTPSPTTSRKQGWLATQMTSCQPDARASTCRPYQYQEGAFSLTPGEFLGSDLSLSASSYDHGNQSRLQSFITSRSGSSG